VTDAALVSLAVFGLVSVLAARDVAVVSGLGLIFFERALVAAPVVFVVAVAVFGLASVLAERDVAVVSDLGLTVVARAPAVVVFFVVVAVFVLPAFHAECVFSLFALPAVPAAHRPLC
jgi:hypothetical protein